MDNNKLNITLLISSFIIFAIAMVYGSYYIYQKNNNIDFLFSKYNKELTSDLNAQIAYQNEMDGKIIDIINNGGYTFDNPCVLNNPYKISPLTSLIMFNTDTPTKVTITVNDTYTKEFSETENHIIPVVGLTTNANNIIKLSMNGIIKEIPIETDSLNEYIDDINVRDYLEQKKNLMLINKSDANPYIRGYDANNNLVYYLKLGNISRANFYENAMQIVYNSKVINKGELQGIKLDIDYLGRIISINKNTEDVTGGIAINSSEHEYLVSPIDLVSNTGDNYELTPLSDTTSVTMPTTMKTESIIEHLTKAEDISEEYELDLNGNYINSNFNNQKVKLLLVSRNNKLTYAYDLSEESSIKINLKGEYAVFIIKDGEYYNLLTTLNI